MTTHSTVLATPEATDRLTLAQLAADAQAALTATVTDHEHHGITLTGHDIAEIPYATLTALVALAHAAADLPGLADQTDRSRGVRLTVDTLREALPAPHPGTSPT